MRHRKTDREGERERARRPERTQKQEESNGRGGSVESLHRSVGNQTLQKLDGDAGLARTDGGVRAPGRRQGSDGSTETGTAPGGTGRGRSSGTAGGSSTPEVEDRSPREVHRKRRHNEDIQVVDVRSPDSFRAGHVPGATNVPLPEVSRKANEFDADGELVTCCRSGRRSREAARALEAEGQTRVTNMAGGYEQWNREVSGASVDRSAREGVIQPKLTVSSPDDKHEREAERVAEAVMQMPDPGPVERTGDETSDSGPARETCSRCGSQGATPSSSVEYGESIQRAPSTCAECEEILQRATGCEERDGPLARSGTGDDREQGGQDVESQIRSVQSGGQQLPDSSRSFFESRFGRDFGDVRVHTGSRADEAARSINAEAFTVGTDIAFRSGAYQPGTREGKQLLAHELTHVVQQNGAGPAGNAGGDRDQGGTPDPGGVSRLTASPRMVQRECADGVWKPEYDGCSVPDDYSDWVVSADNPTGHEDASFAPACEEHDECYQTCEAHRENGEWVYDEDHGENCDWEFGNHMEQICDDAGNPEGPNGYDCHTFADAYWAAVRFAGEETYEERQRTVCSCELGVDN